jgi:NAD(P)-dependent dehydrogenase (short-subunit alcohol dehydrogenase family)
LAEAGARVALVSRKREHLEPAAERIRASGGAALAVAADVRAYEEVERAIAATGTVRGPTFVIPDAIDVSELERLAESSPRDVDLVVAANKSPELGARLAARLARPGRTIDVIDERVPRSELLARLARGRTALLLPNTKEGFYLPAVEAMALGALVVCPDCIGNRSYCLSEVNCLRPDYDEEAIFAAAERALERRAQLAELVERGRETARRHDLRAERDAFQRILLRAGEIWASA